MGHEIIEYRDRHVRLDDMDLWVVRHFLLSEAVDSGDYDLSAFILSWEWIGPGVYLGIDFGRYFKGECSREQAFLKVLDLTRMRLRSFGEVIPLDVLAAKVHLPTAYYTEAQPVDRFVQVLGELEELFTPGWQFSADEISAGVYCVVGVGPGGRRVEAVDCDVERAMATCRDLALRHL